MKVSYKQKFDSKDGLEVKWLLIILCAMIKPKRKILVKYMVIKIRTQNFGAGDPLHSGQQTVINFSNMICLMSNCKPRAA